MAGENLACLFSYLRHLVVTVGLGLRARSSLMVAGDRLRKRNGHRGGRLMFLGGERPHLNRLRMYFYRNLAVHQCDPSVSVWSISKLLGEKSWRSLHESKQQNQYPPASTPQQQDSSLHPGLLKSVFSWQHAVVSALNISPDSSSAQGRIQFSSSSQFPSFHDG